MRDERFVGTWMLTTIESWRSNKKVTNAWGENSVGILMYDAIGYMSVQLMRQDRPTFESGERLGGTPAEIQSAFNGLLTYFGTYEISDKEPLITHHVLGSSFPNWVGTSQKRYFQFLEDKLVLKTPPVLSDGNTTIFILTWERAA